MAISNPIWDAYSEYTRIYAEYQREQENPRRDVGTMRYGTTVASTTAGVTDVVTTMTGPYSNRVVDMRDIDSYLL